MKTKILLTILFISMFLITSVNALETLKPAKLNEQYVITQTCSSCSFVNLTLSNQEGIILSNQEMTLNGSGVWVYEYIPLIVGRHDVAGVGDLDGINTNFATYFDVTPSGFTSTLGFYFLIFLIPASLIVFGFKIEDNWVIILGGFALTFVGLYILFFGIDTIKDPTYTFGFGIITLMTGAYFGIRGSYEAVVDSTKQILYYNKL